MRYLTIVLCVLVLPIALAACDLGEGPQATSTASPVQVTVAPPTSPAVSPTTITISTSQDPFAQVGAALDALSSYRWTARWALTSDQGGQASPLSWRSEGTRVKDGNRWHVTWALGDGDVTLEVVHIGDQEWVKFGDEWVETPTDQQLQFLDFTPRGWWDDAHVGLAEHTQRITPDEQVNDALCQHYRTVESYRGVVVSGGVNWSHQGDVWLAIQGGYPARGRFLGTGSIESVAWTLTQELDVTHVGDPANAVSPPK